MTKFKLFLRFKKGYNNSLKCIRLLKKFLMEKQTQSKSNESTNGAKKKIKAHKKNDETDRTKSSEVIDNSSEEGFIPLAARDSKWVDLAFYNPNFHTQLEDEEYDPEELEIVGLDGSSQPPILLLFPGLSDTGNSSVFSNLASTSDVTKMLVGQKPDFSRMRSSRKLLPTENKLTSVPEMPQEETELNTPSIASYLPSSVTCSGSETIEIHESEEENITRKHIKRRKRLSDLTKNTDSSDSSVNIIDVLRKRPASKPKLRGNSTLIRDTIQNSSNEHFGDDEED